MNLSNNNIKGSGEAIGEALRTSSSIKKLEMKGCSLGPEDASGLAGGIAASASLASLDLRENELGPEGVKVLAPAIGGSASLTGVRWPCCCPFSLLHTSQLRLLCAGGPPNQRDHGQWRGHW